MVWSKLGNIHLIGRKRRQSAALSRAQTGLHSTYLGTRGHDIEPFNSRSHGKAVGLGFPLSFFYPLLLSSSFLFEVSILLI